MLYTVLNLTRNTNQRNKMRSTPDNARAELMAKLAYTDRVIRAEMKEKAQESIEFLKNCKQLRERRQTRGE